MPPKIRAAPATSSTGNPRKTFWPLAPKAPCATKYMPAEKWRTRLIPNWAILRYTNWSRSCRTKHAQYRHHHWRLCAQCSRRRGLRRSFHPPGGRFRSRPASHRACRSRPRPAFGNPRNPRPAAGVARWHGNHRGGIHDRHSGFQRRVGRAVSDRPRQHSCSPFARRAHSEKRTRASGGDLSKYGETVMQTRIEVGILGATGMVGQHFVRFLEGHPWFDLRWLGASDRSAGKKYREAATWHLAGTVPSAIADLTVEDSKPGNAPHLLFSAMDASVATEIEQAFAHAGHIVVSNSKNHRMDRDVPLLVPEINPDHLKLV